MSNKKKKYLYVTPENLPVGSVVFFFSRDHAAKEYAQHVAVVIDHKAEKDKKTAEIRYIPQLAHCTYNDARTIQGAVRSGMTDEFGYFAFKPNNTRLAKHTQTVCFDWTNKKGDEPKIPYDYDRRKAMLQRANQLPTAQASLSDNLNHFESSYKAPLCAVKMAARGKQPISRGSSKGMHCVQFVVLALQVALLRMNKQNNPTLFQSLPELGLDGATGISTKHGHTKWLEKKKKLLATYKQLLETTQREDSGKLPVLLALGQTTKEVKQNYWQTKATQEPIPLSAKDTSPAALLLFLDQNGGGGGARPDGGFGPIHILNPPPKNPNSLPIIPCESSEKSARREHAPDKYEAKTRGQPWRPDINGDKQYISLCRKLLGLSTQSTKRRHADIFRPSIDLDDIQREVKQHLTDLHREERKKKKTKTADPRPCPAPR